MKGICLRHSRRHLRDENKKCRGNIPKGQGPVGGWHRGKQYVCQAVYGLPIENGSRGELVRELQTRLNEQGYNAGTADGIFGSNTETGVKALQSAAGIAADGKAGKDTWTALLEGKTASTPASAHFKLSEFKCKDGTAVPAKYYANCQKLMNLLEEIRTACGNRAITVTSGYRTPAYNEKVDGAKQSQHLYAAAADIKVSGQSAAEVYKLCDRLVGSRGGVGKYSTFTHVDVRGHRARW